jgi:replicative DNA helicase
MPDDPLVDKVPPHNLEAEMAVLGAMMQSTDATGLCVQHLDADCFYRPEHGALFSALAAMFDANHAVDWVTLKEELAQRGDLESVGGGDYLITLVDSVPTVANAEYYARVVKEKALLRGLIQAAAEIIRDAHTMGDPVDNILDVRTILADVMQKVDLVGKRAITGVATGLTDLDDKTRGLQAGELIILAARPSVGKSALALNIAEYVAVDAEQPVAFFSLEMSKSELVLRLLSSRAEVDGQRLRKGDVPVEKARLIVQKVVPYISSKPFYIDDTPALRVIDLRAKCRRLLARYNVKLVIVDYLQLMSSPGAENRQVEVSNISRGLKALARELNLPVLAVAQLRRESEEHKRPRLSDLRESGALEQDADVVLLLHREAMRHAHGTPEYREAEGQAELIIAKQRNGPTDMLRLTWQRQFTRFRTWSPREGPAQYDVEQYETAPPDLQESGTEAPF